MAINNNALASSQATVLSEDGNTLYATIQMRHGKESDMDKSKFVPAEIGVCTDTKKAVVAFAPNETKEIAFKDELSEIVEESLADKLDKNQGEENSGKVLGIGEDGIVLPVDQESGTGGTVSVKVGTTTTGQPGTDASVTNSGTEQNVVLDFVIPRGQQGPSGSKEALYNKAIFVGDSTSQGYDNEDYSFVDIFEENGDFGEVIKLAVGGATLGPYQIVEAANGYSCIEQIQNNIEEFADADVVIIQYCLNDINALAKSKIALGTADDTSETISMWGYTQKIFKTLYEANKYLKIYFVNLTGDSALFGKITELQGGSTAAEYAYWHRYWMTLMKRIRDNYNIQIINAFDDVNINVDTIADYTILTSDGIHLNTAGYQNVYRKIKASLDTESQSLYRTQPEDLIVTAVGSSGSYTLPENSYRLIHQANELGRRIYVFLPDSKIYISLVEFGEYIFGTQFTFANNKPAIIRVGISPENQFSVSLTMISTTAVDTE